MNWPRHSIYLSRFEKAVLGIVTREIRIFTNLEKATQSLLNKSYDVLDHNSNDQSTVVSDGPLAEKTSIPKKKKLKKMLRPKLKQGSS